MSESKEEKKVRKHFEKIVKPCHLFIRKAEKQLLHDWSKLEKKQKKVNELIKENKEIDKQIEKKEAELKKVDKEVDEVEASIAELRKQNPGIFPKRPKSKVGDMMPRERPKRKRKKKVSVTESADSEERQKAEEPKPKKARASRKAK
ncbi:hypothetical protein QR680_006322 [Steinernema hermaphroditum]|uniref:Uncharacterized protein n=1 Tax=Steinernema hermaphroditum TaxID=289476 RepID=A0AA39HW98_9BILA|nr:hypothetical protein QR680_006322 [Steinernema hermaphroditum]